MVTVGTSCARLRLENVGAVQSTDYVGYLVEIVKYVQD